MSEGNGKNGKFVVLEGVDGSGKSTVARELAKALRERGKSVLVTKLPWTLPEDMLVAYRKYRKATQALYSMDARRHWLEVVAPALEEGKIVICDRWRESSFAYQVAGRGLERGLVYDLLDRFGPPREAEPDLMVVLDVDWKVSRKRIQERARQLRDVDYYEKQGRDFFERVRGYYLTLAGDARTLVVGGWLPLETVLDKIGHALVRYDVVELAP